MTQLLIKADALAARIRDYGIDAPTLRSDLMFLCPSYHKTIEHNRLLLTVIQCTQQL